KEHVWIVGSRVEYLRRMLLEADRSDRTEVLSLLDPVQDFLHLRSGGWRQDASITESARAEFGGAVEENHRLAFSRQHPRQFGEIAGALGPARNRRSGIDQRPAIHAPFERGRPPAGQHLATRRSDGA